MRNFRDAKHLGQNIFQNNEEKAWLKTIEALLEEIKPGWRKTRPG